MNFIHGASMLLFLLTFSAVANDPSPEADGWHLTWSDEFDGETLDASKWVAFDLASGVNGELQYFTPEEVHVHGGILTLGAHKRSMGGRDYTTGRIETYGRFSQAFGRVEVRAKIPTGKGMWPAHWLEP